MTLSRIRCAAAALAFVIAPAGTAYGQQSTGRAAPAPLVPIPKRGAVPPVTARERDLLGQTKVPDGFTVTPFAGPPVAAYPTCLANSPDGALFVCVDPNLSLSQRTGVGRIMRLVDDDGDGRADRYTVFAEMDSPRGAFYDGRTLYVVHPPFVTAYRDTNGDGIADESEDLVRGLGFTLDFRGADHTTNQITMGIDGWLYIAVGDYGYQHAVGTDGATIRHRGGSVVRVRPDGTGLEIYATGTRNIYDVTVDPLLHVFARDNTNDGDGWDSRFHYLPALANMGYPMYYKNFDDEHMPSLHDYGAGAATGSVWVNDPGFPADYNNAMYTGDWTLNKVFRHRLTPNGASFDITQDEFMSIPHPSDVVTDARSNMFVASLIGGTFTYAGDSVGGVVRVSYAGAAGAAAPVPSALEIDELLDALVGPYSERRLQSQRELLRRGAQGSIRGWWARRSIINRLEAQTLDSRLPPYARTAAMFTLNLLVGTAANPVLERAAADSTDANIRALALRALVDDRRQRAGVSRALYVHSLADPDRRVQLQAIEGLVRLGAREQAGAIVPFTASADAAVAHIAVNGLIALDAGAITLACMDSASPELRRGLLRTLQQMHDHTTVSGLVQRVATTTDSVARRDIIVALARLYHREGAWNGEWWTTRPSFLGPYYAPVIWEESATIKPVLRDALLSATGAELDTLTREFARNRVLPQGAAALVVAAASLGPARRASVIDALIGSSHLEAPLIAMLPPLDSGGASLHVAVARLLAGETSVGEQLLPLVRRGVLDSTMDAEIRGRLLNSVALFADSSARLAARDLFVQTVPGPGTPAAVEGAWRRYVGDRRREQEMDRWVQLARAGEPAERTLAYSVLAQAARSARTPAQLRAQATAVIDGAWTDASAAPSLAQAVRVMKLESRYAERLASYDAAVASKAAERADAAQAAARIASTVSPRSAGGAAVAPSTTLSPRLAAHGRRVFLATCAACHQPNAAGLADKYPPLAESEWVNGGERRLLRVVLHGLTGDVVVAGETYSGAMPGWGATLSDADIAAVTSYVRANFGNHSGPVSAEAVARVRQEYASRKTPWSVSQLDVTERTRPRKP